MTFRLLIANCNGTASSLSKIKAFLAIFSLVTCFYCLEALSSVTLDPFLPTTVFHRGDRGRAVSLHYGKNVPDVTILNTGHDIIGNVWATSARTKLAVITVYRNQQIEDSSTIMRQIVKVHNQLMETVKGETEFVPTVVWGDFNAPASKCQTMCMQLGLFNQQSAPHKFRDYCTTTEIDHIFTNCEDLRVVFHPPLETICSEVGAMLGHRTIEIGLDYESEVNGNITTNCFDKITTNRTLLKKLIHEHKPRFSAIISSNANLNDKVFKCLTLINDLKRIASKTERVTVDLKNRDQKIQYYIDTDFYNKNFHGCTSASKKFFTVFRKIIKCDVFSAAAGKNESESFAHFLEEKFSKQVLPDKRIGIPMDEGISIKDINITSKNIRRILKEFKSTATDSFGLSGTDFKGLSDSTIFVGIVRDLITLMVKHEEVPKCIKVDIIYGLYKGKKSTSLPNSYRPITIESWLCKTFEKCMYPLVVSNKLNDEHQHAYKKGRSCASALLDLDSWLEVLNPFSSDNDSACVLFLDYAGCFESVSQSVLLSSITCPSIRKLLHSYLQRAPRVGDHIIRTKAFKSIPQGGCLSPALYNRADEILTANFRTECKSRGIQNIQILAYADDHCVVCRRSQLTDIYKIFAECCSAYGMVMEPTKTEILCARDFEIFLFGTKNGPGVKIRSKNVVKWLGYHVRIFKTHLEVDWVAAINRTFAIFKSATFRCQSDQKMRLFEIYVQPLFCIACIFSDATIYDMERRVSEWIGHEIKGSLKIMRRFAEGLLIKNSNLNLQISKADIPSMSNHELSNVTTWRSLSKNLRMLLDNDQKFH